MNGHSMNTFNGAPVYNGKAHAKVVTAPPLNDHDTLRTVGDVKSPYTYELVKEIADFLLAKVPYRPKIGIICGSGMGAMADHLEDPLSFPYQSIPHFPVSTVKGHAGRLVFGKLSGIEVVCMQGRLHHYEGYPLWKCSMPVRVMRLVGCTYLVASNAAGGLDPAYKTGDIMLMKDHVNLMGFAGNGPLQGVNDERFGPRFFGMNKAYDPSLIVAAKQILKDMGASSVIREGVYTALGGPNFETVAELKLLRILGIDAVGMSTVHEVITARHCGMTVFAFSLITNECITEYSNNDDVNHEEVMDVGASRGALLQQLVQKMVQHMGEKLGLNTTETIVTQETAINGDFNEIPH